MPLKDREAYNEYMRRYMLTNRSKKRTQMKAVQMFLEWIAKAKAGDKATLLMYDGNISMENQHPESIARGIANSQHRGSA